MYLVINKCVTAAILSNFSRHYLRNRSTLVIGVLGYIGVFNLRNILPKSDTFLPGHPIYLVLIPLNRVSHITKFSSYSPFCLLVSPVNCQFPTVVTRSKAAKGLQSLVEFFVRFAQFLISEECKHKHVGLSVRPNKTTWLPLGGFSWIFEYFFQNLLRPFKFH